MLIYLPYIRKKTVIISQLIDQLVFYHFYQNHLNVFYKRFSSQHSLLAMFQKWEKVYLSKAFDCIVHDLLLAKLNTYGFDYNSLKLINSFQRGRNLGRKQVLLVVLISIYQWVFLKDQSWVLWFLIYTCAIFFYAIATLRGRYYPLQWGQYGKVRDQNFGAVVLTFDYENSSDLMTFSTGIPSQKFGQPFLWAIQGAGFSLANVL